MGQDKKGGSFLDPRTILAIVFCFGLMILWQNHLIKKYPDHYEKGKTEAQTSPTGETKEVAQPTLNAPGDEKEIQPTAITEPAEEQLLTYEDDNIKFDVSSYGLGIRNIILKKYKRDDGDLIRLSQNSDVPLFSTSWLKSSEPLNFTLNRTSKTEFVGQAKYGDTIVTKKLTVDKNTYALNSEITVSGNRGQYVGLKTMFAEKYEIEDSTIPLIPSYDINGSYIRHGTTTDRVIFAKEDSLEEGFADVGVVSVDTHYFTRALVDNSKVLPKAKIHFDGDDLAYGSLRYSFPPRKGDITFNQLIYIGPKDRDILTKVDQRLAGVLDLGFFSFIGNPILDLLKFFHRMFGNWGVAIILMTLVVRLLLLPFNIVSFKSMKKMQVIQPQLKALKEKYKDDRETLNQETMRLMKESGANPVSGCLPMLLQFPVFIALFQVLGNAIELYQAPFILWIDDLSARDPYFVLPVLMAITMVLQQKLSPTTPDPTTKKAMMVVTVMFSALLIVYPSGLALYIFVGSLFSIIQQLILMRDNVTSTETVEAKA